MSDKFLNNMTAKEYNQYHKELFGKKWKDVHFKGRLQPDLWQRIKDRLLGFEDQGVK